MTPVQEQLNELNAALCDVVAEQRRVEAGNAETKRQCFSLLSDAASSMAFAAVLIDQGESERAAGVLRSFIEALETMLGRVASVTKN